MGDAGLDCFCQCVRIHMRYHQQLAGFHIRCDGCNQPVGGEFWVKGQWGRGYLALGFRFIVYARPACQNSSLSTNKSKKAIFERRVGFKHSGKACGDRVDAVFVDPAR